MASDPPKINWSAADGHGYMMASKHLSSSRLNLQFYLWKQALGFNIHPSIVPSLNPTSVIADVATGTASWLIDVSRSFPDVRLDGFDLTLDQTPHEKWLPKNITLRNWNIFEDPPTECIEKYNFVHVRLLVVVIEEATTGLVLRNLLKLLKPGGYLQWDEMDIANMSVKRADPTISSPSLDELREMCWSEGKYDWTLKLPKFMKQEGFLEVKMESSDDPDELIRAFGDQHLFTMEEFARSLARVGKKEAAEKFYGVIEGAYEEGKGGAALCIPRIVCLGRKPE
jgi:hypothetical protein